jgi:hypothetical protein
MVMLPHSLNLDREAGAGERGRDGVDARAGAARRLADDQALAEAVVHLAGRGGVAGQVHHRAERPGQRQRGGDVAVRVDAGQRRAGRDQRLQEPPWHAVHGRQHGRAWADQWRQRARSGGQRVALEGDHQQVGGGQLGGSGGHRDAVVPVFAVDRCQAQAVGTHRRQRGATRERRNLVPGCRQPRCEQPADGPEAGNAHLHVERLPVVSAGAGIVVVAGQPPLARVFPRLR